MRRLTIALALTVMVGASPVLATQTPTPTGTPTASPTLEAKTNHGHGETNFAAMEYGTVQFDPASVAADEAAFQDVRIPGIQKGDMIVFYPPADLESGLIYSGARIKSNNIVSIRLAASITVNGGSKVWEYVWWDRTSAVQPNPTAAAAPSLTPTSTNTPTATDTPTATPTPP